MGRCLVPFIHCRPASGSVIIWEEPKRMFVGNAKQNGATDYDEEVEISFNLINQLLNFGSGYSELLTEVTRRTSWQSSEMR